MTETPLVKTDHNAVARWLFVVCGMIFLMVVVGGATRLTESGLSMVHWKPVSGMIPPLNDHQWATEFAAYQRYPEYQKINHGMTLGEFKAIFFWEYSHRLLGRLIGLVFFLPFVFFLWRKRLAGTLKPHLWLIFILGGCQGLLGWWMVKSGLVDHPEVSHYRLVAHLGLAVVLYLYIFRVASGLIKPPSAPPLPVKPRPLRLIRLLIGLVFIQILCGGLLAGLNGGLIYNSWPLMAEQIIPDGLYALNPWYHNIVDDIMTIQFNHRMLAYIIAGLGLVVWMRLRHDPYAPLQRASGLMILMLAGQILLGVLTLIHQVPISLAVAHQAGALVLLTLLLVTLHLGEEQA